MTLKLYDYQKTGQLFLETHSKALLADCPGLGKTIQVIAALDNLKIKGRVLIICPAIAKVNWKRELEQKSSITRKILVQQGTACLNKGAADSDVIIVNYDLLSRKDSPIAKLLAKVNWEVVVADEAHALKSTSNRAKAVYNVKTGIINNAKRVWLLTGTPAPNHAGELYNHFRYLHPELIGNGKGAPMSRQDFEDRYCHVGQDPKYGRRINGSRKSMFPELKEMLSKFMLKRHKSQVLTELPPLSFRTVPLENGLSVTLDRQMLSALDSKDEKELLKKLRQGSLLDADDPVSTIRRQTGLVKIKPAFEWIVNEMDSGVDKLIVFGWHRDVLLSLNNMLGAYQSVLVMGGTPPARKQGAIDAFQNDPDTRIIVGQLTAMSEAVTLTASSRVVFVEAAWTPATNYQAASRAHRFGQKDAVLAQMLVLENSYDERVGEVLARKAEEQALLFG